MQKTKVTSTLVGRELERYLENTNMEPWYYIYENFVNPPTKKKHE